MEMTNNITVTVALSANDRARLDKIIDLLGGIKGEPVKVDVLKDEPRPLKPESPGAKPTTKPTPSPKVVKDEEPTVTLDDVRLLVQRLATPSSGKRDAVRAIVMKHAKSVSDIPADKLGDVHAELVALDKEV